MITREDVDAAAARIAGRVRVTPVVEVAAGAVWFKLELLQHTGTFKARGAFNRVLSARESGELDARVGIVVASGGNAGLANAYAAAALGVPATVFVPTTAPAVKVARLRAYGAHVVQAGSEYAEAYEAARRARHGGRRGLCPRLRSARGRRRGRRVRSGAARSGGGRHDPRRGRRRRVDGRHRRRRGGRGADRRGRAHDVPDPAHARSRAAARSTSPCPGSPPTRSARAGSARSPTPSPRAPACSPCW